MSYQTEIGSLMASGYNKLGTQEAMNDMFIVGGVEQMDYIVRRLTPNECCRLQGFPDYWGEIDQKDDFTDEEYAFWLEVRNTWAEINGRQTKEYTKEQMLKWYNNLHTDSAEYKMWGNGLCLQCALYVMQGIVDADERNRNECSDSSGQTDS